MRSKGAALLLYVTDTEPTTPDATTEYTLVSQVDRLARNGQRGEIVATDRDGQTTLGGEFGYTIPLVANGDLMNDAGQALLFDSIYNETPLWWLITPAVTGQYQERGTGRVTTVNGTYDTNSPLTEGFSISGDGAIIREVVP